MENRLPLPTDNIYKFYALFGLLLFIFSLGALLHQNRAYNEIIFAAIPEIEDLKHVAQPTASQKAKILVLERRIDISKSDHNFQTIALGSLGGVAGILMYYGFRRWHTRIQPVVDRTAIIQLEIAEFRLKKLKQEQAKEEDSKTGA